MSEPTDGTVMCRKYAKRMQALPAPPMPGPKGLELQQTVSKQAWEEWRQHQTMLINENRLNLRDAQTRKWLTEQMELFLSGEDYARPSGYRPPDDGDKG